MARAQKGDPKPGHRQVSWRLDDQDPGADGRLGQPGALCTAAGPGHDTIGVAPLIEGVEFEGLIADKAFDANWIIKELDERGAKVCVSQMPWRKQPRDIDRDVYKWRHLIENFFCKLKKLKRVAMRNDKTDESFAAMIHLNATLINSP